MITKKKNMFLISIIIPLYNKDFIINETLQSVIGQTYTNYEVIIINDGSTDNSLDIVSQFKDSRISIYNQTNKGVAAARNMGIKKSNGELIAFLDADDYWYPNHLEELIKLYYNFPDCGMYCSRYKTQISKKKKVKNNFIGVNNKFYGILDNYFEANLINRVPTSSSIIIPKKILTQQMNFNTNVTYGEDTELWTKIAINHNVAITNKTTVIYYYHIENSLSKMDFKLQKLPNFNQFKDSEINNKSLKKFLDVYRLEFSLKYRISGDLIKSKYYLDDIDTKIPLKTLLLLKLPPKILNISQVLKKWLRNKGISFTIYQYFF